MKRIIPILALAAVGAFVVPVDAQDRRATNRVAKNKAQGKVNWVEHLGDQNHLHVSVGDHALVTLADPQSDLKRDDPVNVQVTKPLFFGADGERMR